MVQIKGQRVGYERTTLRLADADGRQVAKVRQVTKLSLQRFGQETKLEVDYSDTETDEGVLLDFELVMKQVGGSHATTGKVVGNRLELQIESQGQKQNHSVAWPEGAGGMLAAELSLRQPLKEGETPLDRASQHRQSNVYHGNVGREGNIGRIAGRQFPPAENRLGRSRRS